MSEKDQEEKVEVNSNDQEHDMHIEIKGDEKRSKPKSEKTSVSVEEESKIELYESKISELQELLTNEKQNYSSSKEKLKRSLADFQNLQKKTYLDIENGVNAKIDSFMKNFLFLYDDFVRAKTALSNENIDVAGFESILKNMNSFLSEYGVTPINALGEIFDPNFHEAISVVEDSTLDEGTITKEIRKGYISHDRVIRPTVVEISKKSNSEKSSD
ncbi:MAG: nucleotide exchange factor GrpE [Nitrosopumilaceae archaeon]